MYIVKEYSVPKVPVITTQRGEQRNPKYLYDKTCWIHLTDAVEQGTISPMEAYDALNLGYLPEHLKVRKSRYSHLL